MKSNTWGQVAPILVLATCYAPHLPVLLLNEHGHGC